ncbi:MAG TPA: nucleoside hydrolase [Bacteroidales bacterium]|nr:nucleoside hydrolase [Bacteroidales bacterium]
MKKNIYLLLVSLLMLNTAIGFSQKNIILDTDFGGDADDLGALVMLNHFIDKGECNLLAVVSWSTEQYVIPAIDAVNRYYGHPDIPLGIRQADNYYESWNYNKVIADGFAHTMTNKDAEDATVLYRRILARSKDNSIVIVTIGPLYNIQALLQSGADSLSPLTGKELVSKKVKEFVIMGGQFPEGKDEWNFNGNMPEVTQFVLANIPVPVTYSGFEIGNAIKTGEVFNNIDPNQPLYVGFKHFSANAPWIKANYKGKILNNSTFDQTAVLYAIRNGVGKYWEKIDQGYCKPDENGGNVWIHTENPTQQGYLKLTAPPEKMATLIEKLMLGKL